MVTPQSQNVHISFHKNELVGSHQSVGRWLIFCVSWKEYFDESSWLSTAYLSLCQDGIRG